MAKQCKNSCFSEAIEWMSRFKSPVRRKSWEKNHYIYEWQNGYYFKHEGGYCHGHIGSFDDDVYTFTKDDFMADDWESYDYTDWVNNGLKEMAQDEEDVSDHCIESWEKFNSLEEWNEDLDLQMDIKQKNGDDTDD